jgi:uncharacterized Zn-binding protein involved in type VI secretion
MGDTGAGVCPSHSPPKNYTTVFNIGANTVNTNGLPSITMGSVGISDCGHPTIALVGSSSVFVEGKGSHRIGDTGSNAGAYVALVGSPNVIDGG